MIEAYKEFNFDESKFSLQELQLINLLKEALKIGGEIHKKQVSSDFVGVNFYPANITKEEVLEAAKNNSDLLSPYTVVQRLADGTLKAVKYSEEYAFELTNLQNVLTESLKVCEDAQLKGYIESVIKAAKDDSWEELENYWLTIEGNRIDFQFAPIEPYNDGLLNIKHSFQGSLRFTSERKSLNVNDFVEIIKTIKTSTTNKDSLLSDEKVLVRIDDQIASCGNHAVSPSRGSNYPNDPDKVKQFGTKIILFTNNIIDIDTSIFKNFNTKVLDSKIAEDLNNQDLSNIYILDVALHEIAEAFMKYSDSQTRLQDLFLTVKELHSTLVGFRIASLYVLHGAITAKDYDNLIYSRWISRMFATYKRYIEKNRKNDSLVWYVNGYTITYNYFVENGAFIEQEGHKIKIDFNKIYGVLEHLTDRIEYLMSAGSYNEAKEFIEKYFNDSFYSKYQA